MAHSFGDVPFFSQFSAIVAGCRRFAAGMYMSLFYVFVKNLMFFVKKLLTSIKRGGIVQLTINIKTFTFIVHFLARVLKIKTNNKQITIKNQNSK